MQEGTRRTLSDHIVEGDSVNHQVAIAVVDEPGQGGASHCYELSWSGTATKPTIAELEKILAEGSASPVLWPSGVVTLDHKQFIRFQNGPIKEVGVNGITQEALLAIVIDRLRSFQAGPYPCRENEAALVLCQDALGLLQQRTLTQIKRGVEGTAAA